MGLEKEMAAHSNVLAWRISGAGELTSGGLTSMGSHRVGHNWSDLAAEKEARDCSQRGQLSGLSKKIPQESQRMPQRGSFWFTFKWLGRTGRNQAPLHPQLQDTAEKKPEDCQLHLTRNQRPEVIVQKPEGWMEPTEKLPHGRHQQRRKHSSQHNQRNQLDCRRHK